MPKVIQSPVKHFPGTVTLSDPWTMPQLVSFEKALQEAKEYYEDVDGKRVLKATAVLADPDVKYLHGILACVDEWNIKGFPEVVTFENFPTTPASKFREFIMWLFLELLKVYNGENEVPNE